MMKLSLVLCVLAVWAVVEVKCASPHNAPAPSVDCSSLILNMADCLTFVTNGSTISKPEGNCCNGLKKVLKTDAACLCESFKSSAQLGVELNVTKSMSLPSACGVSVPSFSNCRLSGAPGASPAHSPALAPSPIASTSGGSAETPALGPSQSGASGAAISFVALLVSLVVASCSYF